MAGFSRFAANAPAETRPAETVGAICRIRRRTELIFKCRKSLRNIHVLRGFEPERIQRLIYAKPAAAVLMTLVYGYSVFRAGCLYRRETGFFKLIGRLKRGGGFESQPANPESVLAAPDKRLPRLTKQKRKRKTTLELIEAGVGYLDTLAERIESGKKTEKNI